MYNFKEIKKISKEKLPTWCIFVLYYIRYLFLKFKVGIYVKENKLKDTANLKIKNYKKSNTLFILGSGASIVNISSEEWKIIRKSDSFGFNHWIVHDFVPTFYMFECENPKKLVFFRNLKQKAEKYKRVPIIYKGLTNQPIDLDRFPSQLRKNLYISALFLFQCEDVISFSQIIKYMKKLKMFSQSEKMRIHMQCRASISDIIIFGVIAGYKNIVLCGVDLNKINYFYEADSNYYKKKGLLIPFSEQKGPIHRTIDKTVGNLTIDEIVYTLNEIVLKPMGINLYVAFNSSALYPKIPFYFRKL
ncbi:hypothetical protein ES705_19534 [subsurface metagenome]